MTPGSCFICGFPMPNAGFKSLATAEGKYAVHDPCKAMLPLALCDGSLTAARMSQLRATGALFDFKEPPAVGIQDSPVVAPVARKGRLGRLWQHISTWRRS